jgi:tetratricopeptide (TPR) repeat protein
VLRAQTRYEAAIPEYESAVALNRNWVNAAAALGLCKFHVGAIEEAIPAQELAIRLSSRDPRLPNWYWRVGMVHLLKARVDDAICWLEKARGANPRLPGPRAWLASAYALAGNRECAAAELVEARQLSGDNRYASIANFKRANAPGGEDAGHSRGHLLRRPARGRDARGVSAKPASLVTFAAHCPQYAHSQPSSSSGSAVIPVLGE